MAGLTSRPATFVVGHPRSGTSLLRALLDGHPDLLVLPFETHFLDWAGSEDPARALLDRTRFWPTLHRHQPDVSRDEVEGALREAFARTTTPGEHLPALVDAWARLTGSDTGARWVEKTPRHLYELSTFRQWYGPETRILALRRDPRDVAASQLEQDATRSLFALALTCRVAHEALRGEEARGDVHVVGYEDLVSEPEGAMRGVCDFLDVDFHPATLRPTVMGDPYSGNSRFQESMEGVSTAPVGRHRGALTDPQRRRLEALLSPVLEAGGYAYDGGGAVARLPERMVLAALARSGVWRSRSLRRALRS